MTMRLGPSPLPRTCAIATVCLGSLVLHLEIARAEPPTVVALNAGPARVSSGWNYYPLEVTFTDPDGDLRGGLMIVSHGSAQFDVALEYAVFDQTSGTASIPVISDWSSGSVVLVDRGGSTSNAVDLVSPNGTLADAEYALTPEVLLYDDFDGHGATQSFDGRPLAVAGSISRWLWAVSAQDRRSVMAAEAPHATTGGGTGNAIRFEHRRHWKDASHAYLISPGFMVLTKYYHPPGTPIDFPTFGALAADILVSSESTSQEFAAALTLSVGFATDEYGARLRGWHLGVRRDRATGDLWAYARDDNLHFPDRSRTVDLVRVQADEWHRFRLECEILSASMMRFHFLIDGVERTTMDPDVSEILLNHRYQSWSEPSRSLMVTKPNPDGVAVAYFDNVDAVYEDRQR